MNRPAIISYTELTLPFPSARDLWLAPTAEAWRDIWTAKYRLTDCSELHLRDLLSDPSLMNQLPPELDLEVARSALLQGLALQVWEFRQQMLLSQTSRSGPRATTRLWLQSRQEDLYVWCLCDIYEFNNLTPASPGIQPFELCKKTPQAHPRSRRC
jgi:hypothetical protein